MTATGARVSPGTRMLISTINCPVLVNTAVCSTAHSSGAPRLALAHHATHPAGAGAVSAAGAGVACVTGAGGAPLALGAWAWPRPDRAKVAATAMESLTEIFTEPAPK